MMINNFWLQIGIAIACGLALGWLYFGTLWLTVQRLIKNANQTRFLLVLVVSYLLRLAFALLIFYWLATLGIWPLLAGVAAFSLVALLYTLRRTRSDRTRTGTDYADKKNKNPLSSASNNK